MATRPWVEPSEVREYSEFSCVQERSEHRLTVDIARAEQYIIWYCGRDFHDMALPESVRLATLILAEAYAYNASAAGGDGATGTTVSSGGKRLKSETYDDYSYTSDDGAYSLVYDGSGKSVFDQIEWLLFPWRRKKITLRTRVL